MVWFLHSPLNTKVNVDELNQYVDFIEQNSFDFEFIEFQQEMLTKFQKGGLTSLAEISSNEIEKYMKKRKLFFEKLSQEIIKKINQYNSKSKTSSKI